MLWFSSKRNKDVIDKDQLCTAVNEAWRLSDELSDMGAEQTGFGWNIAERACHISSDESISNEVSEIGAEQTVMGMSVSEHACHLDEQLKIIADQNGCKLTPRTYG